MTTTRKLKLADLVDMDFAVMSRDAGQIVEYSYGLWADGCGGGLVIRRVHDRSDGSVLYYAAEAGETFEPQNGIVEVVGEYAPLMLSR